MQCVSKEGYGYLCAVGGLVLMADSRALLAAKIHDLALLRLRTWAVNTLSPTLLRAYFLKASDVGDISPPIFLIFRQILG